MGGVGNGRGSESQARANVLYMFFMNVDTFIEPKNIYSNRCLDLAASSFGLHPINSFTFIMLRRSQAQV